MTKRRKSLFSFLLAAGILVHFNIFNSIKTIDDNRVACIGEDCGAPADVHNANIRGSANELQIPQTRDEPSNTATNSNKEPVHVVYAADSSDGSLKGVEQSIKSVMHFSSEPVVFHFVGSAPLSTNLSNVHYYNLKNITRDYNLQDFTNPKKRFGKKRKTLNSSTANYVRFIMDSLLPTNVSKAMWIDADTIIKCDVVPMIRQALTSTNYTVAAVGIKGRPQSLSKAAQNMFRGIKQTFNAGVFVVDLDRWRQRNVTERIRNVSLINKKKKLYRLGSQPPLTLIIGNDFEHLPPAWNVKVPFVKEYFKEYGDEADVCLVHWVGGRKPWDTKENLRSTHKEWWYRYQDDKPITRESLTAVKRRKWA